VVQEPKPTCSVLSSNYQTWDLVYDAVDPNLSDLVSGSSNTTKYRQMKATGPAQHQKIFEEFRGGGGSLGLARKKRVRVRFEPQPNQYLFRVQGLGFRV